MLQRLFDIVVSLAALVVLAVPFALVAFAVKLSSPGPVFFLQRRVGRGGKEFFLYKFRTMRAGAGGPQVTTAGDSRITPVGSFLRKWKIDELPQFWNIFCNDMTIIGPRPEVERYVRHYTPEQGEILKAKPGLASVSALVFAHEGELLKDCPDREEAYIRYLMPRKLEIDLEYERRRTWWTDLKLMVEIALAVLGKNPRLDRGYRIPVCTGAPPVGTEG
jgi:lipopolysaccharide/colanic/teichoic acid biosynthesis glycosyltransferase